MPMCVLHQKERLYAYLTEAMPGSGVYQCSPGNECKGGGITSTPTSGGGAVNYMLAVPPDTSVMCSIHHRLRPAGSCTQAQTSEAGALAWECKAEDRCKGGETSSDRYAPYEKPDKKEEKAKEEKKKSQNKSSQPAVVEETPAVEPNVMTPEQIAAYQQYVQMLSFGYGYSDPYGLSSLYGPSASGGAPGTYMCAIHNKRRTLQNLQEISTGVYTCMGADPCKTGPR
eukprot:TRINITY_DN8346_c0_g1_i1.p1 TRINITY_DN8346_c0_g1~~TRINITY_DN8346_c0_g1_i1.p1  ORF type:complete len:246 (+),score=57.34 TRINITY_DN8346_c0_g1_i1:59-739(+)